MPPRLMSRESWLFRYAVAVAAVAAGVLLRLFLTSLVGEGLPTFITFFPFVMLAGLLGGFGPGLLTTAAFALVADYWLMVPYGRFGAGEALDAMALAVFSGMGVFISVMMELYRRARRRAELLVRQLSPFERPDVPARSWSEGLLLGGGLLLSLGILVGAGWQALRSMAAVSEADRRVAHTYAVGEGVDHLLSTFQDLQASVRGYVLTGRAEYLAAYTTAWPAPAKRLAELKTQTADNPEQVRRVAALEAMVAAKLAAWQGIIDVRRTNGFDAAQALISSSNAQAATEDVRRQLEQVQNVEDQALAERTSAKEISLSHTREAILAGGMLSLLILAAVFVFLVRENAWRREAEGEVRRHRDHLQDLVAARTAALAQANESLGQQREWLHVTLHSIGDAVLAADTGGRVTFLNPVAQTLTGWSEQEALGQPVQQVFRTANEETGSPGEDIFARVLREGNVVALANHTALVTRDGRRIPIEDSAAPIRDNLGRTSGVVLVFHDVTERRRAQAAVQETLEQRRLALEAAELGSWDYRFLTGEVFWDHRCREMFGLPQAEVIQYSQAIERVHPEDRKGVQQGIQRALAGVDGGAYHREFRVVWPDDSVHWIASHGQVYFEDEGEQRRPSRFIGANYEITPRKRREEQLQRLNRTLKALTDSSRAMMHARNETEYLNEVCRIISEDCGHAMVWIGFAENDEAKSVRPVAHAGFEEGYLQTLRITWADAERGRGPTGTAIRTGKPRLCANMRTDSQFAPWREEALKRGYASSLVVPLLAEGKTFGAMTIYAKIPDAFSEDEARLLAELGDDVSYCITALRLRSERALAERLGTAINSVNAVIHSKLDPAQVLQSAVNEAARAVGCDTAAVSFRRDGRWVVSHTHGFPPETIGLEMSVADEPHAELAVRSRQPVAITDAFADARVNRDHMRQWGIRSVLVVPLITEREAPGALFLNFQKAMLAFDNLHLDFARKLASSLTLALENAHLFNQLRRELTERGRAERRTELLASVASELLSSEAPQPVIEALCQKVLGFLDCQVFFNYLAEEPTTPWAVTNDGAREIRTAAAGDGSPTAGRRGRLRLNACAGIPAEEAHKIEWLEYGTAVCGCVARDGCRIVAEDILNTPDPLTELVKSYGVQAYACHPLLSGRRVLGTLSFGTRTRTRFSEEDLALMKAVADQVAIAMERERVQAVLRENAEDLRRSNQDLEQFAYVASHDLQEPLRAVGGYLRLLERRASESLDGRARELLDGAVEGALRMERLIQDLLAYSRVGSRGGNFVATDLEAMLRQVLGNLQVSMRTSPVTITHDPLPMLTVDATQIMQLFQNLIGNALKFRSARPPRIHVGAEQRDGRWTFRVTDNGIGIERDYYEKIFQLFQRLHTRKDYAGTGIGLAVCKKIVERHGGRIWVDSSPGQGSTFFFTIPVR